MSYRVTIIMTSMVTVVIASLFTIVINNNDLVVVKLIMIKLILRLILVIFN